MLRWFWMVLAGADGAWKACCAVALLVLVFVPCMLGGLITLLEMAAAVGIVETSVQGWSEILRSFGPALVCALVAGLAINLRAEIRSNFARLCAAVLAAGFVFVLIEGVWLPLFAFYQGHFSDPVGLDLLKLLLLLLADAAVAFSLLWTARCLLGAAFGNTQLAKSSWKGTLIGAALAATIALMQGAPPLRFVLSDWFYGLLVPALVGMAWVNRGPREPSHLLALALLGSTGVIAASAVPVPFIERDYVDCQPWKAEHQVLGVGGIPLIEWDLREWAIGVPAAPVIIPETMLLTIFHPLDERRC
jgi:hypothetical protein